MTAVPSFACPRCGATSWNPNDVREGYCGRCHDWTGERRLDAPAGVEQGVVLELPGGKRIRGLTWPPEPGLPRVGDVLVTGAGVRWSVVAVEWQMDGWVPVGTVVVLGAVARR